MSMSRQAWCVHASFAIAFALTLVSSTDAAIVSSGGDVVVAEPPSSILLEEWTSSTEIRVWFERETTLASDLTLDHVDPGFVDDWAEVVAGAVPAGTTVLSHMLRFDPVGEEQHYFVDGFATFDWPILGVIASKGNLDGTDDLLGRPGVAYNKNDCRGLELDGDGLSVDWFEISADRLRLDLNINVAEWTDDIRVITAPEPATFMFVLLAAGVARPPWRQR